MSWVITVFKKSGGMGSGIGRGCVYVGEDICIRISKIGFLVTM
jgi:hypothetical protein